MKDVIIILITAITMVTYSLDPRNPQMPEPREYFSEYEEDQTEETQMNTTSTATVVDTNIINTETEILETETPETDMEETEMPDTYMEETEMPETYEEETEMPETYEEETEMPETYEEETEMPDTYTEETEMPDTYMEETEMPETYEEETENNTTANATDIESDIIDLSELDESDDPETDSLDEDFPLFPDAPGLPEPDIPDYWNSSEIPNDHSFEGYNKDDFKWRYMIYILIRTSQELEYCSGCLVKKDLVLSSAHCFYYTSVEPSDLLLIGGKADLRDFLSERIEVEFDGYFNEEPYGTQTVRARDIYLPPHYDNRTSFHDISLIRTLQPFGLEKTKVIPWNVGKIMHRRECILVGFGLSTGDPPEPRIGVTDLLYTYPMHLKNCKGEYLSPLLCVKTDTVGSCLEHSGSPLICVGHVFGVGSLAYITKCQINSEMYYSALYVDREWLMSIYLDKQSSVTSDFKIILTCFTITLLTKPLICKHIL